MPGTLEGLKLLSSRNNTARRTIEAVSSNDNILCTFYHYISHCNLTTKRWGLKEKMQDEVIQRISQSLIASIQFQGSQ